MARVVILALPVGEGQGSRVPLRQAGGRGETHGWKDNETLVTGGTGI